MKDLRPDVKQHRKLTRHRRPILTISGRVRKPPTNRRLLIRGSRSTVKHSGKKRHLIIFGRLDQDLRDRYLPSKDNNWFANNKPSQYKEIRL